jgi:hypothetical protein
MGARAGFAVIAIVLAASADAASSKHDWVPVPSHENVLVDLNSICDMPRMKSRQGMWSLEDTSVDLRINGHPAFDWIDCNPPPGVDEGRTDHEQFEDNGHVIGYTPSNAIKAMVCKVRPSQKPCITTAR